MPALKGPDAPDWRVVGVANHPLHARVDAPVPEVDVVLAVVMLPHFPASSGSIHTIYVRNLLKCAYVHTSQYTYRR